MIIQKKHINNSILRCTSDKRQEIETILKLTADNWKVFENIIINNCFIPLNEKDVYLYTFLDRHKQIKNQILDSISNYQNNDIKNIKELDNNNFYFVIENQYNKNFHHCINETVLLMDIYIKHLNQFPNVKILLRKGEPNQPKYYSNFYKNFVDLLPKSKVTFIENEKLIRGNFIFMLPYSPYGIDKYKINYIFSIKNRPMISEIIIRSIKRYGTHIKYKKIYISRRHLDNKSWHNRYMTNINQISDSIVRSGYIEIFTDQIKDFLYQVYLINHADEIILELGAGCDNIIFMKNNSTMTIIGNNTIESHLWLKRFYVYNNKVKINNKLLGKTDKTSEFYSPSIKNKCNFPYIYNKEISDLSSKMLSPIMRSSSEI